MYSYENFHLMKFCLNNLRFTTFNNKSKLNFISQFKYKNETSGFWKGLTVTTFDKWIRMMAFNCLNGSVNVIQTGRKKTESFMVPLYFKGRGPGINSSQSKNVGKIQLSSAAFTFDNHF